MRNGTAGTGSAVREELEGFSDDFKFAAFFAGFLVVPSIHLETAFNIDSASFGEVLLGKFCLAPPKGDIHEDGFFLFLVLFVVPDAIDGKGNVRDGGALGCVPKLGIPGEIPDEHDFVEIGHNGGINSNSGGERQEKTVLSNNFYFKRCAGNVGGGRGR